MSAGFLSDDPCWNSRLPVQKPGFFKKPGFSRRLFGMSLFHASRAEAQPLLVVFVGCQPRTLTPRPALASLQRFPDHLCAFPIKPHKMHLPEIDGRHFFLVRLGVYEWQADSNHLERPPGIGRNHFEPHQFVWR